MIQYFELSVGDMDLASSREFNYECFALSFKYTYELSKLKFINYLRINIRVSASYPENDNIWLSPGNGPVQNICYRQSIEGYRSLSEKDKYAFQLKIVNEGLQSLSQKAGWDFTLIQAIGSDILKADFVLAVPIKLKGLKDNYQFLVRLGLKSQTFYIRFTNPDGNISEVDIFEGFVGPLYMYNLFYSAKYENEYLKITGINKRITFEVNLSTLQVTIAYSEKNLEFILPGLSPKATRDDWSSSLNAIDEIWKKK